jgi:hypothetical protein
MIRRYYVPNSNSFPFVAGHAYRETRRLGDLAFVEVPEVAQPDPWGWAIRLDGTCAFMGNGWTTNYRSA